MKYIVVRDASGWTAKKKLLQVLSCELPSRKQAIGEAAYHTTECKHLNGNVFIIAKEEATDIAEQSVTRATALQMEDTLYELLAMYTDLATSTGHQDTNTESKIKAAKKLMMQVSVEL